MIITAKVTQPSPHLAFAFILELSEGARAKMREMVNNAITRDDGAPPFTDEEIVTHFIRIGLNAPLPATTTDNPNAA